MQNQQKKHQRMSLQVRIEMFVCMFADSRAWTHATETSVIHVSNNFHVPFHVVVLKIALRQ